MRCAVYVRVSTDHLEQKTSLENQKHLFYSYIEQQGWELAEIYLDIESGTTDKRENFQRMIQDAEKGKFDCILAKELSRLARNGELAYKIKRVLQSSKIQLITLDGAINTPEDNTDKFGLYAWLYEEESQRISKRIQIALKEKAKRGEFKGSNAPYGYEVKDKQLVARKDDTVDVIKLIFYLYLQGKGIETIARHLDSLGYPTPAQVAGKKNAGQFWQGTSVKLILQNPHYVGDLVQGRSKVRSLVDKIRDDIPEGEWIVIPNSHEPIISREDFEAVQNMMKSRYKKRPKAKKHLFTNVIYCSDCGTAMWYMQDRKGYVCGRYRKHGKNACTSHFVKEIGLVNAILSELRILVNKVIDGKGMVENLVEKVNKTITGEKKKLKKIEDEILQLKEENKELIKLLARKIISESEYKETTESNRKRVIQLQENMLGITDLLQDHKEGNNKLDKYQKVIEQILQLNDLNEGLLHRVIERIEITQEKEVNVHFRFASPITF
ncbi:site-specific DNA recombinase [Neobacillus sp. B4I6]|uniref:recombinase family protein n=1 Tax=Neobacillus sp. B4I6 TaxID=3373925 RepID=UPI003D1D14B5